ncbi:TonB-dependent siderophore receptor [Azospirillum sp. B4]|uniref:TonB-dependent siderophore receptor n=1 Tax=Azospirillum sp. B4 TaxID=95605 RepID=UPI00034C0A17|nr:TonB-dependent siderophore receptor [Azospirillum sp. B4]
MTNLRQFLTVSRLSKSRRAPSRLSTPRWVVASAVSAVALMASAAHADDAAAGTDATANEVLVLGRRSATDATSALKSDAPLVETPQSVSVIGREELNLRVAENLNDALNYTAGVATDTRGNTAGRYDLMTVRGFNADQYLDGLHLISSVNGYATPQIDLSFLERVEVVKGPASVLYGNANPGGIAALTSKLPTGQTFGEVSVTAGSYGTVRETADIGGTLDANGMLSYRLVGVNDRSDTQISHTESERFGVSPSITYRPDDKTSWTVLYVHQQDPKSGAYGSVPVQGSLLSNPNGQIARDFYDGEPDFERFNRTENMVTSLFTHKFDDDWAVHQNTRYMHLTTLYNSVYNAGYFTDANETRLARALAVAREELNNVTLDNNVTGVVRTGALTHNLIFGVDFQNTVQTEASGFGGSVADIDVFNPVYGSALTLPATSFDVRLHMSQTGVYAQDQIALGGFRLVLSGRNDWLDISQLDHLSNGTTSKDESKFTGRAGLLYLFDNGVAPYVSYATSFLPQTTVDRNGNVLAPTEGKQVEVGVKYQPKVWNALLTASLYELRETNVATTDPSFPTASIAAGEVRSRGVELEGSAHPITGLTLHASYTYIDNQVTKDNSGLEGTRPYAVPQTTANGYANYVLQDGPLAGLGFGGGVRYIGRGYNGVAGSGSLTIPGATLFDLMGSYDFKHLAPQLEGLTLNIDATNLLDRRYISSCYSSIWCWYGPGRDVKANVAYRW